MMGGGIAISSRADAGAAEVGVGVGFGVGAGVGVGVGVGIGKGTDSTTPSSWTVSGEGDGEGDVALGGLFIKDPHAEAKGSASKQHDSPSSSYRQVPHPILHPRRRWSAPSCLCQEGL